ncbi:MAG: cysteine desulfurase [Clostridia bacterium]|nr:cysteine desulfurase [Clostridia bacterium]
MIYLDNSATTALAPEVRAAMLEVWDNVGNPSSLHAAGLAAKKRLESARSSLLASAGLKAIEWQTIFCGSGSEANNLAILGSAHTGRHLDSRRVLITDSEHASVENTAEVLASRGFEIVRIPTKGGALDLNAIEIEAKKGVCLASFMLVNNETGAIYDIESAAEIIKKACPSALIHCDAVQGFMRIPLPSAKNIDFFSVSAHKIHGPAGVGALFLRRELIKKRYLCPVIFGGGQEEGLRSGTENLAGAVGFAKAAEIMKPHADENYKHMLTLSLYAIEKIKEAGATVNIPAVRAPHILSITLPHIKSQTMLNLLSAGGICVSSGSACSSNAKNRHVSSALRAFGLSEADADCTIRMSLCKDNTREDIDAFAELLALGIGRLVKIKR